ncbi:MAG TPA: ABC transporter substrate-binding protein [Smithellaceae bacterium]|nr:ABC transporter substrate-binding protein [Smithellaceae bacterium]HPI50994.1 ABC transporter substrate-binding protein [Smithellaceae bacterium]HQN67632.1 ABC transporter substrate-binding protein [Smithellaceae bacterium]HQP06496.1 ABC transporter substrate-binding protein [Smithellaceae bacterium]
MKHTFILIALLVICSLCVFGCAQKDSDAVRIGVIAELTGDIPAVGASCKNAAELAVREINDNGGILLGEKKYPVELIIEDNAGKADQSASSAQKLITQQKVTAIVGPNASRYALPAAEIAESGKTVLITPWSTAPKATLNSKSNASKKYVFRACFIDPFQGGVIAKFTLDDLKLKKTAVLYDVASEYNKGIAEIFKEVYEKNGGTIVAFETYTTNDKDFSSQLTKIKKANPDIIFLPNYYSEVPLQIQQAKRLGISVPFIGSDSWGSEELLKLCGKDCEGYYFSTHYAADSASDETKKFIATYKAKYGTTPDDVAALTYDSFGLLAQAIKTAGKNDRQAVRDALAKIPLYNGVTGSMQFKEGSGDPIKSAVILQIKDGKFTWFANAKP